LKENIQILKSHLEEIMEPDQETKSHLNKFLVAITIVLALLLIFQTGYVMKLKKSSNAKKEKPKQVQLYTNRPSAMAVVPQPAFNAWGNGQWDPFTEMERMQEYMNRMFRDSFRRASSLMDSDAGQNMLDSFFEPDLDIQDLKDRYLITLDIPGMEKDKLNIEVRDQFITVSGERTSASEKKDEQQGFYSMERRVGAFQRTIPLPADAVSTDVKANYDKGELRIEVPKKAPAPAAKQEAKARKIPVQ
jgi:HSP20 family protein